MDVKDQNQLEKLKAEIGKLHARHELAGNVSEYYFEPGMMEYLDQSEGILNEETGKLLLRFEARGTRYEGRTEQIEKVTLHDEIRITRDACNSYNGNNFRLLTARGKDIGNMPAELCDALAPLYDSDCLMIESAHVSYVEPISQRSRYAKQAVLFVEINGVISEAVSSAAFEIPSGTTIPENEVLENVQNLESVSEIAEVPVPEKGTSSDPALLKNEDSENVQSQNSISEIAKAPIPEVETVRTQEEIISEEFEAPAQIFVESVPQSDTSADELTTDEKTEDSHSRYQSAVLEWREACKEIRRKQVNEYLNLLEQMRSDHLTEITRQKQDSLEAQEKVIRDLQEEMAAAKKRHSSLSFFKFQEKKRLRIRIEQIEQEINAAVKEKEKIAFVADTKARQADNWINERKQKTWEKVSEMFPLIPMPRAQKSDSIDEKTYAAIQDRYAILDTVVAGMPFTIDSLMKDNPEFSCSPEEQMFQLLTEMVEESLLSIENGKDIYRISEEKRSLSIMPEDIYDGIVNRRAQANKI